MNKSNLNSILIGLKKGFLLETLPHSVRLFLNKPIVRIFRVIGGLSVLFCLMHKNGIISYNLPYTLYIILTILALIQLMQIVIISVIKLVYSLNKLIRHREEFEVRNSPLNRLASLTINLAYCWKVGCQAGSTSVGLLGASVLIDGALASAGQEKIFEPMMNKGISALVGSRQAKDVYAELANKTKLLNTETEKYDLLIKDIDSSKTSIAELVKNKIFSAEDGKLINEGLDEIKNSNYSKLKENASTLRDEYIAEYKKRFGKK